MGKDGGGEGEVGSWPSNPKLKNFTHVNFTHLKCHLWLLDVNPTILVIQTCMAKRVMFSLKIKGFLVLVSLSWVVYLLEFTVLSVICKPQQGTAWVSTS